MKTSIHKFKREVPKESLMKRYSCPLCEAPDFKECFEIQSIGNVLMNECDRCQLKFVSHIPTPMYLERYYDSQFSEYFEAFNPGSGKKVTFGKESRFAKHLSRRLSGRLPDRANFRILDFGGGDGSLAYAFADNLVLNSTTVVSITCCDYVSDLVQSNNPNIALVHIHDLKQVDTRFDLIIASASLEHTPNPGEIIESFDSILAPGGFIYIRTNYISPFIGISKKIDFSFPAHLEEFNPESLHFFLESNAPGLKIVEIRPAIVELSFISHPIFHLISRLFKFPGVLENIIFGKVSKLRWPLVGAFEVLITKS